MLYSDKKLININWLAVSYRLEVYSSVYNLYLIQNVRIGNLLVQSLSNPNVRFCNKDRNIHT